MTNVPFEKRLEVRQRPTQASIMYQEWRNLFFLHWEYESELLQKTLPPGLTVDTYEGKGYVSIVPFLIKNFSTGPLPIPVPLLFSSLVEVNVRTYVYDKNGVPGIWFYSLDINSLVLAKLARLLFSLPYYNASLNQVVKNKTTSIEGNRGDSPMVFRYEPQGLGKQQHEETLEFFLIERYVLFSFYANQLYKQSIHHKPYTIHPGNLIEYKSNLFELNQLDHPGDTHLVHYSAGVDVEFFPLANISA